jgi:D-3-phosphoglycerate dehydrogenase
MTDPVEALIVDLLEWVGPQGRPYREVMDAWRTSCPRLPVWEEANSRGFLLQGRGAGDVPMVFLSDAGRARLAALVRT